MFSIWAEYVEQRLVTLVFYFKLIDSHDSVARVNPISIVKSVPNNADFLHIFLIRMDICCSEPFEHLMITFAPPFFTFCQARWVKWL